MCVVGVAFSAAPMSGGRATPGILSLAATDVYRLTMYTTDLYKREFSPPQMSIVLPLGKHRAMSYHGGCIIFNHYQILKGQLLLPPNSQRR